MVPAASYPPLHRTQERGTHSSVAGTKTRKAGPPAEPYRVFRDEAAEGGAVVSGPIELPRPKFSHFAPGGRPGMSVAEPPLSERALLRSVPLPVSKMRGFQLFRALHSGGSRGLHAQARPAASPLSEQTELTRISRPLWRNWCIQSKRTIRPLTPSTPCATVATQRA